MAPAIFEVEKRDGGGWKKGSVFTLASGNVSLKNVGSHDKRVKKVLAVQRCVTITALFRKGRETDFQNESFYLKNVFKIFFNNHLYNSL